MSENCGKNWHESWELFNLQNRVFWASKSVSKKTQILKPFWHRFCDDFARPGNVKNEQKRGRVALFLISGVCKMSAVLERFWGGFGEALGGFLGAFWASCGVL